MNLTTLVRELNATFLLSVAAFLLAMALTPLYTYFAYRYKFWKKQRAASTTGEELTVLPSSMPINSRAISPPWPG